MAQLSGLFTIWCAPDDPPRCDHPIVLWESFAEASPGNEGCFSIPALVTRHKVRLRPLILKAFSTQEFSLKRSGPTTDSRSEIDPLYWAMSLPSQFPLIAGSIAYELARTRALLDLLDAKKPDAVEIIQPPQELLNVVADWCAKNSSSLSVPHRKKHPKSLWEKFDISGWKSFVPGVMKGFIILAKHAAMSLTMTRTVQKYRLKNVANVFVGYIDSEPLNAPSEKRKHKFWGSLVEIVNGHAQPSVFLHIDHVSRNRRQRNKARMALNAKSGRHQHIEHHLLDDFLGPMGIVRAINWYRAIRKSAKVVTEEAVRKSSSEMGFNTAWLISSVTKDAVYGATAMRNALWLSIFDEVARQLNPQRVVYLMENQAWEKALLRSMGTEVKSYGFIHSSVRFWDLRYFFSPVDKGPTRLFPSPTKVLVGSKADRETLTNGGIKKELLHEVEAVRYLYLSEFADPTMAVPENSAAAEILIVGDYDTAYSQQQIALANTIHSAMAGGTGPKVRFRPHPSNSSQLTTLTSGILISGGRSFQEDLEDASVIICSHLSSASIDAEASGKPTIIVPDPRFFVDGLNDTALRIICISVEEMLPLLNSLLTGSKKAYKKTVPNGLFVDNSLPRWQALLFDDTAHEIT